MRRVLSAEAACLRSNSLHSLSVLANNDNARLDTPARGPERQTTGPGAQHTAWTCRCRSATTSLGLLCPIYGDYTGIAGRWAYVCAVVTARRAPQIGCPKPGFPRSRR